MTDLADKLKAIKPSPTLAVTAKVAEMRAAGEDVISLGAGEPDFDTPDHIKEAAIKAIWEGKTKYTKVDGIPELKEAVALKFRRDNGLEYGADQISINCGGKHTIYNALVATLNPGDEVLIPKPYWVSYPDMVRLVGAEPVFIDTSPDTGLKVTPDALEAAITPQTKWFIFNSPSNPTGVGYSHDEIAGLGEVLLRHPRVMILSDDIYEHIVYDGFAFSTMAAVVPDLYGRTLTTNGVAKAYAMTGWRIGFAGGPADLIKAMAKVQSQSTSNPCSVSQWASVEALTGSQDFLAERCKAFEQRRNFVVGKIGEIAGLECLNPNGAFYVFVNCLAYIGKKTPSGGTIGSDLDFVAYLLDSQAVATVPGGAFGMADHFRISYATSLDALKEAFERIGEACRALA
ncbi:MAG: pyridoxal phosphate-dependent aminotransferase [Sphingomonadales bacterium]